MPIRLSHQALKVLRVFLDERAANVRTRLSGADVMRRTGISAGTMYPLLLRFEGEGFLESEWERQRPQDLGRPRRRLYRLTGVGVRAAEDALTPFSMPFVRQHQKA